MMSICGDSRRARRAHSWRAFSAGALALAVTLTAREAHAGGHLWLGAEFAGEGNVYRYNIDTGVVDLTVSPALPAGGNHFNNIATDGTYVYYGTPTTQYLGVADIHTGVVVNPTTYSTNLGGHKEDGAYSCERASLWRATFSGNLLHETTLNGTLLQSYTGSSLSGLVGLDWVGETLYATNYNTGTFGEITLDGTTATYTVIPFADVDPPGNAGALAYDKDDDMLYAVFNRKDLYTVTIAGGMATVEFVVDLTTVGYPNGGLVDGMGWAPPTSKGVPCLADFVTSATFAPPPDGVVDAADLAFLLGEWGPNPGSPADIVYSGTFAPPSDCHVDAADLAFLLGDWGPCE